MAEKLKEQLQATARDSIDNPLGLPQPGVLVQSKPYVFIAMPESYENSGDTAADHQEIKLAAGQALATLKDTVLHEILHAIERGYQFKMAEKTVHVLAGALLDVLWSNPNLAYWLINRELEIVPKNTKKKKEKVPSSPKAKKEITAPETKKASSKKKKPPMGFLNG